MEGVNMRYPILCWRRLVNGMSKKIAIVVGTRPEAIKLIPLILEFREREHNIVTACSGQHGTLIRDATHSLDFNFDHYLRIYDSSISLEENFSLVVQSSSEWYEKDNIDLVIVQGDTLTATASAMGAFLKQIPVLHIEAGLRTHDLKNPFPEEGFRQMISRIATHHFCPTEHDCDNLINEGVEEDFISVVGNTVIDGLIAYEGNSVWPKSYSIPKDDFVVLVTCHRRESWGERLDELVKIIPKIPAKVYVICHPNPVVKNKFSSIDKKVEVGDSVPYFEMLAMMKRANLIITDSGGITEEASYLGKPIIVYRDKTERMGVIEGGCGVLTMDGDVILKKVEEAKSGDWGCTPYLGYGVGDSCKQIVDIIEERFLRIDKEERS
jgi:UDP-N-acetylglucosamine 2-epimerase (non-hydrolysing)